MKYNKVFLTIELLIIGAILVLGVLWARNPQGNYEPFITIISGVILAVLEITRRILEARARSTSTKPNQPMRQRTTKETKSAQGNIYEVKAGNNASQIAAGENIRQTTQKK